VTKLLTKPMHEQFNPIDIPAHYDYVGVYLTNRCFLSCDYCITNHNDALFINNRFHGTELNEDQWIAGLNRLKLPDGIPLTFQGGDPFIYPGIWKILESVKHPIDILTALPNNVTLKKFKSLATLQWNKRTSPYPTIRVSYHKGQNDYRELIPRISELQKILDIGLYHIDHPAYPQETQKIRDLANKYKVEFRTKEYLGRYQGKMYGKYLYPDAVKGRIMKDEVFCKNTVVPIGPTGHLYRCHSDLYQQRLDNSIGHLLDRDAVFSDQYRSCNFYGTCSECDIKIKTNHLQLHGYTSVDIKFPN
jgi:organic radical activating enzyme